MTTKIRGKFTESQSRRHRFARYVPVVGARDFQLALVDAIAAGRVERVKVLAAESEVRESVVWRRNNALHSPGLIADLNAHRSGDIQSAFAVDANAIGVALVRSVRHVQPVEALFVIECAVSFDEIAINPMRAIVRDVKQSLIRR